MPRRQLLTPLERASLLEPPHGEYELDQLSAFNTRDLEMIRQHRGDANRLGVAVLLCYLRHPGIALEEGRRPALRLLRKVACALNAKEADWDRYAARDQTRREHLVKLYAYLGVRPYRPADGQMVLCHLTQLAIQTDQALTLALAMVAWLRQGGIVLPTIGVIERTCAAARTRGARQVYQQLNDALTDCQRRKLDALLLRRAECKTTTLAWLRARGRDAAPSRKQQQMVEMLGLPSSLARLASSERILALAHDGDGINGHHVSEPEAPYRIATLGAIVLQTRATLLRMLSNLERLKTIDTLSLPAEVSSCISAPRMRRLATEGRLMTAKDLAKLEPRRRVATLLAMMLELRASLVTEILDLRDSLSGRPPRSDISQPMRR
ncbi:DUF4158 domain-containing protein [Chromobacterium sp. ATCC 53434]|uniref:DUF4158 domain-containing protein n=1 Tax=Chromobacterium sp. (strain ATCC 53434 / SC 14030) TaxID=2059672 RepID=UPI001305365D|nr:DUF4158 domain-containing protein [Chromobacterium sp. ATCC 53434]